MSFAAAEFKLLIWQYQMAQFDVYSFSNYYTHPDNWYRNVDTTLSKLSVKGTIADIFHKNLCSVSSTGCLLLPALQKNPEIWFSASHVTFLPSNQPVSTHWTKCQSNASDDRRLWGDKWQTGHITEVSKSPMKVSKWRTDHWLTSGWCHFSCKVKQNILRSYTAVMSTMLTQMYWPVTADMVRKDRQYMPNVT